MREYLAKIKRLSLRILELERENRELKRDVARMWVKLAMSNFEKTKGQQAKTGSVSGVQSANHAVAKI